MIPPLAPRGAAWVVVGPAPGAREQAAAALAAARSSGLPVVVAAANGGMAYVDRADLVWMTDSRAIKIHADLLPPLLAGGAVWLINSLVRRSWFPHALRDAPARVLEYDYRHADAWTPGRLANCRTSGGLLLQVAALHDAAEVRVAGMAGYTSGLPGGGGPRIDYEDGRSGVPEHAAIMAGYYGPCVQSLLDQTPATRWIWHGLPAYPWRGPNVSLADGPMPPADPDVVRAWAEARREVLRGSPGASRVPVRPPGAAAVLCPGPSLRGVDAAAVVAAAPDGVVAVNAAIGLPGLAAAARAAGVPLYWALQDPEAISDALADPEATAAIEDRSLVAVVGEGLRDRLRDPALAAEAALLADRPLRTFGDVLHDAWPPSLRPPPCRAWTACVAYATAVLLLAEAGRDGGEVRVYGADMAGETDYRGRLCPPHGRDDLRWTLERDRVAAVSQWAASRRVTLRILRPGVLGGEEAAA